MIKATQSTVLGFSQPGSDKHRRGGPCLPVPTPSHPRGDLPSLRHLDLDLSRLLVSLVGWLPKCCALWLWRLPALRMMNEVEKGLGPLRAVPAVMWYICCTFCRRSWQFRKGSFKSCLLLLDRKSKVQIRKRLKNHLLSLYSQSWIILKIWVPYGQNINNAEEPKVKCKYPVP